MAIIVNNEKIPVTIDEMEVYFNPASDESLTDIGLAKIYELTNAEGKANWQILSKKYNRPASVATARYLKYALYAVLAYFIYKKISSKK